MNDFNRIAEAYIAAWNAEAGSRSVLIESGLYRRRRLSRPDHAG